MKKSLLLILAMMVAGAFSSVSAQLPGAPEGAGTPAGGGDRNLGDNGVKMRSVELERAKRDAQKAEADKFAPVSNEITAKFPEIKEDFEGIQNSQMAIVKAYTQGTKIDYATIESSADVIGNHAKRLDLNLFASTKKDKKEKDKAEKEEPKTLKDLIVALDNAIGSFVSSKIFVDLNAIAPEEAIKTRTDLLMILDLSSKLSAEAKKSK